ncbi:PD-(D/E)XK nuclease family protein, partial [Planctomycetota bacterium]
MNLKFILGRSGSGKTHYCLQAIRAELSRGAQGYPLILLVPEQATFQMEQALLADDQPAGYHRAQVVSFARLARLVLQQTEPPAAATLSSSAKQMILRRLLQQYRDKLTIFARSADRAGFIAELSRLISELRQYQKTPEQLLEQRQQLLQQDNPHLMGLTDKLTDLALIYRAYQDYIADRFIDPDDFLDLLTIRCERAEILREAQLWVDGFAGFTPQQYNALKAIVKQVDRAQITLCLDPQSEQFRLADDPAPTEVSLEDTDLFHPTLQTYRRLRRLFAEGQGYPLEKIILPDEGAPPPGAASGVVMPRFGHSSVLAQLEHNLFGTGNVQKIMPRQGVGMPAGPDDIPVKDIVIAETAQRRQEVEAVAAHILRLCREHNYRFRDIAVILRDFADYQQLLEAAFTDHGIAYFLDQRRSVRHHPLIELLRSVVQV